MAKLYKVESAVPGQSGMQGRFIFRDGISLWLLKRTADRALGCGAAVASQSSVAPYFAVLEWDGQDPASDEQIAEIIGTNWVLPNGARILGCAQAIVLPTEEQKKAAQVPPKSVYVKPVYVKPTEGQLSTAGVEGPAKPAVIHKKSKKHAKSQKRSKRSKR
jgi:hypothetical protein